MKQQTRSASGYSSMLYGRTQKIGGLLAGLALLASAGCQDHRIPLSEYLQQTDERQAEAVEAEPAATQPALQSWSPGPYKLGPGDVLGIQISGVEDLGITVGEQVRITEKGEVVLPMVGRVPVGGLTLDQAEAEIKGRYVPKYVKDTDVTMQVLQYEPVGVMVLGDVLRLQGGAQMVELKRHRASVLQALLSSGGAQDYGGQVTVIPARDPDHPVTYNLGNRSDLVRAARVGSVEEADIVMVDSRPNDAVYIQGLVNAPGPIPMPRSARLTVLQAIGAAGGPMLAFEPREATLMRHEEDGKLVSVKIDLDRIKKGADPDMLLATGDVLILPHNAATRIEEYIARSFQFRVGTGVETTYNPWTLYYLRKERGNQGGGFFQSLTNQLQTGAITPLVNQVTGATGN